MPEEFYRGGSRSPFKASAWAGAIAASPGGASTTLLTIQGNTIERLKRIQVMAMLVKTTSANAGWLAFYREDPDTSTSVTGLDISNPQVLRPKVYVTNPDHAIYIELYLEAITLDAGGKLHIMGKNLSNTFGGAVLAAKWYSESSVR